MTVEVEPFFNRKYQIATDGVMTLRASNVTCSNIIFKLQADKKTLGHIRIAKPQISLRSHALGHDIRYLSFIFNKIPLLCR